MMKVTMMNHVPPVVRSSPSAIAFACRWCDWLSLMFIENVDSDDSGLEALCTQASCLSRVTVAVSLPNGRQVTQNARLSRAGIDGLVSLL